MAGRFAPALVLLALAAPVSAADCPPAPDVSRIQEPSVRAQWKEWCECCGGTIDDSARTCTKGSNWRCGTESGAGTAEQNAADAAAAAMVAASQGQGEIAAGYGLLSAAYLFGASLNEASANAKSRQAAELARKQAEAEEQRRIAALIAEEQRRKDEIAISTLKTESPRELALKSIGQAEALKGSSNGWDGGATLPDPDSTPVATPRTVAALAPSAPEKSWNAPRCEAQVAAMRELDAEMSKDMENLRNDLKQSSRDYLKKEYGIDDATAKLKNATLDALGVRELYDQAAAHYNSAMFEFSSCLRSGKGVIECLDVGRRLEQRAEALMDEAAERAGIKGAKDRVAKAGAATRTAAQESHRIFADASPRAAAILGSPCPQQ